MKTLPALLIAALICFAGCGQPDPASGDESASTAALSARTACRADHDCQGPLPQYCLICSDGSSECAHFACVSGQCEVQTCPPVVVAPPQCVRASDCHGALPQVCEICSGGKSECAHFACVSGQCETEICP